MELWRLLMARHWLKMTGQALGNSASGVWVASLEVYTETSCLFVSTISAAYCEVMSALPTVE